MSYRRWITHLQSEKFRLGSERRNEQLFCNPSPTTPNGTVSLLAFSAPVPSVDGWFHVLLTELKALIYALLCLLVSRIHAKEVEPSWGSTERFDQAGRINIVPDFIFAAYKPAHGTGQAVCGAGPASKGWLLAVPWPTCTELIDPRGEVLQRTVYAPFSWQKWNNFTGSLWGVAHVVLLFGHDVPGPRISLCAIYILLTCCDTTWYQFKVSSFWQQRCWTSWSASSQYEELALLC